MEEQQLDPYAGGRAQRHQQAVANAVAALRRGASLREVAGLDHDQQDHGPHLAGCEGAQD